MNAPVTTTLPELGASFGGGFYGGLVSLNGAVHMIVVASKKDGQLKGKWGLYGNKIEGAGNFVDGLTNTRAMAAAGSEFAQKFLDMRMGGHDDWHMPARDVKEVLYRNLKPGTRENYCSHMDGYNANSVPPSELYTENFPAQTVAEAFREGGEEAFDLDWYWTSTQFSADLAFLQDFGDGNQSYDGKGLTNCARAVRLIRL